MVVFNDVNMQSPGDSSLAFASQKQPPVNIKMHS